MKKREPIRADRTLAIAIEGKVSAIRKALKGLPNLLHLADNQTLILTPAYTEHDRTQRWHVGIAWDLTRPYFRGLIEDAQLRCEFSSELDELRSGLLKALAVLAPDIEKYRGHSEEALPGAWNSFADHDLAAALHVQGKTLAEMHERLAAAWPGRKIDHPHFHNTWHTGRWNVPYHSLRGFPIATDGWEPMEGQVGKRGRRHNSLEASVSLSQMDIGEGRYFSAKQPNRKLVVPKVYSDSEVDYIGLGENLAGMIRHPLLIVRPETVKAVNRTKTRSTIVFEQRRNEAPVRMAAVPEDVIERGRQLAKKLDDLASKAGAAKSYSLRARTSTTKAFEPDAVSYPDFRERMKDLREPALKDIENARLQEMANNLKAIYLDSMEREEVPWLRMAREMKRQFG